MNESKTSKTVKFILLIPLLWILFGFFYTHDRMRVMKKQEFENISKSMKHKLETIIDEKKEAILIIAMAISSDTHVNDLLIGKENTVLDLNKFSLKLKKNTSLKNIWFQVIDSKGVSRYRSWTDKHGDDLSQARLDVLQMTKKPDIYSTISTGKFDLTFKSMVPIYKNAEFIGSVEALAKFNSISKKMTKEGVDIAILVDEKYKKQLTRASKEMFLGDNFIANIDAKEELLEYIRSKGVKHFIDLKSTFADKSKHRLFTTYHLNAIDGTPMAYFIMSNNLNESSLESVIRTRDRLTLFFGAVFIFLIILIYYLYFKRYRRFIQNINKELELKVEEKTDELTQRSQEFDYLAHHDTLTSLPNRLLFNDRLKQSLRHAKRDNGSVSILFLDLDRFKEVNDTFGHDVGDILLKTVAKRLKESVREVDTISRLGGDEFTILVKNVSQDNIVKVSEKIINSMKKKVIINNNEVYTSFSIGISRFPEDGDTIEILLRNADTAMYKAKEIGKNTYQFYNKEMTTQTLERLAIETSLRYAVQRKELVAYFQPKIDARDEQVVGLEALVRWNHPTKGLIFPDQFITIAEETGLIVDIDTWMMSEVAHIVTQWHKEGIYTGRVSLNLSMKQLESKELFEYLSVLVSEDGINASTLELEITESQIMSNPQYTIDMLTKIQDIGISIAVDDFGTGHSSLSYLKHLPVDVLKIDKSFIDGVGNDEDDEAIVNTIIALAKNLKLDIIAEGVESKEQVDFLIEAGCPNIQGYYYAKPMPLDECKEFLLR